MSCFEEAANQDVAMRCAVHKPIFVSPQVTDPPLDSSFFVLSLYEIPSHFSETLRKRLVSRLFSDFPFHAPLLAYMNTATSSYCYCIHRLKTSL